MGTGWAVIAYENTMARFKSDFRAAPVFQSWWVDQDEWPFWNVKLPSALLLCNSNGSYHLSYTHSNRKQQVGLPSLSIRRWCSLDMPEEFERFNRGDRLELFEMNPYTIPITEIPGCFTQPFLIERRDGWVLLPRVTRGTGIRLMTGAHTHVKRWFPLPNFSSPLNPASQKEGWASDEFKKYVDLHAEIAKLKSLC